MIYYSTVYDYMRATWCEMLFVLCYFRLSIKITQYTADVGPSKEIEHTLYLSAKEADVSRRRHGGTIKNTFSSHL